MFYISLPYFYENFKFNQYFKKYVDNANRTNSDKLIKKFDISYVHGAFPWSYWNGEINTHGGEAILASEIHKLFHSTYIPIRIDASNVYLNDKNYLDIYENTILKNADGTNTVYEISNIEIMNYISTKNLNNKFIISNNAQLICPFNTDILNIFQKQDEIELINIGYHLNFLDNTNINLSDIINKSKIELSIGHCQKCLNKKQLLCADNEQKNIYNFSGQSMYINCPCEYKPINYFNEIEPYLKKNITNFKIITNSSNLKDFNINIIKSFIKLEYQGECIDGYYREVTE